MNLEAATRQMAPAQAMALAEMVKFEPGAVVSRILTKSPAGNVTLFSFDELQELSEHTAPFDALVLVVEGKGEFVIGGAPVEVKTGQVVLMPANVPHSVHAKEPMKMLLIMIRG
jgi:quercetin dioxygenase-like cupin family protein